MQNNDRRDSQQQKEERGGDRGSENDSQPSSKPPACSASREVSGQHRWKRACTEDALVSRSTLQQRTRTVCNSKMPFKKKKKVIRHSGAISLLSVSPLSHSLLSALTQQAKPTKNKNKTKKKNKKTHTNNHAHI